MTRQSVPVPVPPVPASIIAAVRASAAIASASREHSSVRLCDTEQRRLIVPVGMNVGSSPIRIVFRRPMVAIHHAVIRCAPPLHLLAHSVDGWSAAHGLGLALSNKFGPKERLARRSIPGILLASGSTTQLPVRVYGLR